MKKPKNRAYKMLSFLLAFIMLIGVFPTEVFALSDPPLSGSTGTGWDNFTIDGGDDSSPDLTTNPPKTLEVPPSNEVPADVIPAEDLPISDDSERPWEINSVPLEWSLNFSAVSDNVGTIEVVSDTNVNPYLRTGKPPATISGVEAKPVSWTGGTIYFADEVKSYHIYSGGAHRILYDGGKKEAICGEFNGRAAGGTYTYHSTQKNPRIRQWIANYEKSGKTDNDLVTLQALVWGHLLTTGTPKWGGFVPSSKVINGTADYSEVQYHLYTANDNTQNIFVWDNSSGYIPGEPDDPDNPDKPDEPSPEGDGSAWGQVTIIKKDGNGDPLAGAVFDIDVKFANGGKGGTSRFQVKDGANTYTYYHPKGDTSKATVTVTEVEAPAGYISDSSPQTIHVTPSYYTYEEDEDGNIIKTDFHQGDYGSSIELTFVNQEEEAHLEIYKYQKGNSSIGLSGAQFEITSMDSGSSFKTTGTTDESGYLRVSLPRAGSYQVKETKAPDGYVIDVDGSGNNVLFIEVARGETKSLDIPNDKKGGLTIVKRDAQDGRLLSGATFRITHIDTGETKEGVTDAKGECANVKEHRKTAYARRLIC